MIGGKEMYPQRRRRWPWIVVGIVVALALLGALLAARHFRPPTGGNGSVTNPTPAVVEPTPAIGASAPVTSTGGTVAEAAMLESCPTTGQAQTLIGLPVARISTEPCAVTWRGKPTWKEAICPVGAVCTWDVVNDITVVHSGIGQKAKIYAGTWRWNVDVCAVFAGEKQNAASENPTFDVRFQQVPGGVDCK